MVLIVYGGLNVLAGALVLSGVIHRSGSTDWTALRWHVGVWDLWFLVWGILLAAANGRVLAADRRPPHPERAALAPWASGSPNSAP